MQPWLKKSLLALTSTTVCLLVLEAGARLAKGVPLTYRVNFVETRVSLMKSVFPTQYDAQLGWIPKPGDHSRANYWSTTLTIRPDGTRANGPEAPAGDTTAPRVLAVGDSFTFGSQVGDEETWPAGLARLTGARVVNGGVFAYGLDQAVLRAEQLVPRLKPAVLIVSFIPDNVHRVERAVRTGVAKPYFDVVDGRLALRNVPVPRTDAAKRLGLFRRVCGYSYLVDGLMRRSGREAWWYLGDWENVRAHRRGPEVACLLMARLAELGRREGCRVAILAQYTGEEGATPPPESARTVACAAADGLPVLDLYAPLRELAQYQPARFASFFRGHMTAAGNAFVAAQVAEFLKREKLLP